VLVAEDDDIVPTYDKHVAKLFTVSYPTLFLLVEQVWVRPKVQESLLPQIGKEPFCLGCATPPENRLIHFFRHVEPF
jgi:hypothetical protein